MLSHVLVGTNDLERSRKFYDAVLRPLGVGEPMVLPDRFLYISPEGSFGAISPINGQPATVANGGTVAFKADSPEKIDAWHAAGVANGGTSCEDPPGVRDMGAMKLYLTYLHDPDGNKICAVHYM